MAHLLLLNLVFILVISCSINQKDYIKFKCKNNFIVLDKSEYQITEYKRYIEIKILRESKLDLVKELMGCSVILVFDKKRYIAKAINYKESRKPEDCDYFFSEYDNGCIIVQDELIFLKKVDL